MVYCTLFPNSLHTHQKLEAFLPSKPGEPSLGPDVEEVDMVDFEGTRGAEGRSREVYADSDDEDYHGGGQRVGCSHQ